MGVSTSEKNSQDDAWSLHSHSLNTPSSSRTSSGHSHQELEKAFEPLSQHPSRATGTSLSRHATTIAPTLSHEPDFEVDWDENDPANPVNWPTWYKGVTIFSVAWSTFVVVVYSTSYTSGLRPMMTDFHVDSEPVVTLGVTTYLMGLAVGSMLLAPISEMYGRKPVYVASMLVFTILIIPCALGHSLSEVIIVRFFGAIAGAAMIANSPGTIGDISTEEYRALFFSIWSIGPLNGPTFGPIIGGFATQYLGWRFTNWIVMMMAGTAFAALFIIKETYSPVLLRKRVKERRKETGDDRFWCRYDNQKLSFVNLMRINLKRPFVMILTEPICMFWDFYVAVIYAILYLSFVAYPIVFTEIRQWSLGMTGLSFTGIGVGSFITIFSEPLIRRMIQRHKVDPETGKVPPEAMVSIVCVAALLAPIGELWFAWTCVPPVHWVVPILAGIPFGAGNTAVFIYASNYLAHSYGIYAASAMAGNSLFRSLLGGTLPLAGAKMYSSMNPHWAGTFLGLLQIAIIPIPLVFYKYGHKIRRKSVLIQQMRKDRERLERRSPKAPPNFEEQTSKEHENMVRVASNLV